MENILKVIYMKKKNLKFYQRSSFDISKYWQPGMPLTEEDLDLLKEVKEVYHKQGYIPSKKEVSDVGRLKARFRTWDNVLLAAGLPSKNNPDEQRKRQEAARLRKEDRQEFVEACMKLCYTNMN